MVVYEKKIISKLLLSQCFLTCFFFFENSYSLMNPKALFCASFSEDFLFTLLYRWLQRFPCLHCFFPAAMSEASPRPPQLIFCVFIIKSNVTCHWEPGDVSATHYTLQVQRKPGWDKVFLSCQMYTRPELQTQKVNNSLKGESGVQILYKEMYLNI